MTKEQYLQQIDDIIAKGKYKDNWQSLSHHKTPDWFTYGKLGIFIHWGIYSVPAFGNEWYSRTMYDKNHREFEHHIKTYGTQDKFGYKDFIPMFKAEKFSADKWAELFKKSGAKYVMPVCEHHDGFAMYETDFNRWNAKDMGPCRDVAGELKKLCAYYYNRAEEWGKEVTINYKHEAFPPTVATFDVERGALTGISPVPWQTDTAIGKRSWGYTTDNEYKSSYKILCDLIDIVSKNGNLLINIGPKADGTITDEETAVLLNIGSWLDKNSEGIYGTTFWSQFGEGEANVTEGFFKDNDEILYTNCDFRFTYKDGFVYAFQMKPNGKNAKIKAFKKHTPHDFLVNSVTLLSTGESLEFERTDEEMIIKATDDFNSQNPICFKIEIG